MMNLLFLTLMAFSGMTQVSSFRNTFEQENREMLSSIINIADKIQNAVPTQPTTPLPTVSPTASPAPSPAPSGTPTQSPTLSMAPSTSPTIAPTISHAPTNHPTISSAPSSSPSESPTDMPSASPSHAPTQTPTVSSAPSSLPSASPTQEPSSTPSRAPTNLPSISPSMAPSSYPTVSAAPTLIYYETMTATTTIKLEALDKKMNATQIALFESVAKEFIQFNMLSVDGDVSITSVTVLSQSFMNGSANGSRRRRLSSGLNIEITTVGEYASLVPPDKFDFKKKIEGSFESNFALFRSNLLDSGDRFFSPLDPTFISHIKRETSRDNGLSKGGYAAVIICSILVSILAIAASYYAIRKAANESKKGDKLPEVNMYDDPVGSNLTQDSVGPSMKNSKSIEIIQVSDSPEKPQEQQEELAVQSEQTHDRRIQIQSSPKVTSSKEDFTEIISTEHFKNSVTREQITSPNTMETGRMGALAESILRNESFGSSRDPPESSGRFSNYGASKMKGDPVANYSKTNYNHKQIPRHETDHQEKRDTFGEDNDGNMHSRQRDPSVVGTSQFSNGKMLNSFFPKEPERRVQQLERSKLDSAVMGNHTSEWMSDASQDVELTVGRNGKLSGSTLPQKKNRATDNELSPSSSAVSSSINAFLNMVGGGIGTLGAAPLSSSAVKKEETNKNFHDVMQREGLYDVLAPSGALGIVVDTTKDGPAVHSLKQTSPMLGLINPGDLIIGLDSQDTRSMTAATLTRLMASKSHQKERKITLLAADNY